jgi:hypothetical protein
MIKRHNSAGTDEIPAESIKAWERTIRSEIHKLINSIWNKDELPEEWKESIIVPKNVVIIEVYNFFQVHTKFCPTYCCQR